MATQAQINKIYAIRNSMNLDYEDILNEAEEVVGRSVLSVGDLTTAEASELIDKLEHDIGTN